MLLCGCRLNVSMGHPVPYISLLCRFPRGRRGVVASCFLLLTGNPGSGSLMTAFEWAHGMALALAGMHGMGRGEGEREKEREPPQSAWTLRVALGVVARRRRVDTGSPRGSTGRAVITRSVRRYGESDAYGVADSMWYYRSSAEQLQVGGRSESASEVMAIEMGV